MGGNLTGTEKRRICCFCERWGSGGIESFLNNVLCHLDLSSLEIDIAAARLEASIFTEGLRQRGVRFYELSGAPQNVRKNRVEFLKLTKTRRYDVVHLNVFHGWSLRYAWLAKRAGVPVVIAHSHNTALRKSPARPLKLFIHALSKMVFSGCTTDLWACSAPAAAFLFSSAALRKKGFSFVPNGIDTRRFAFNRHIREELREELNMDGAFVIGSVGRLCSQKNQSFLLDVFRAVLHQEPDSRLLLVGDGEDRAALQKKAERLGVLEKVIFYGTSASIEKLLWAMDVFAFPSKFEGLGIAAIEAQAAGLPVVMSEFVPEEAQLAQSVQVVPLKKGPEQWADALLSAARTPPEARMAGAACVREAGFDISDVAREIGMYYRRKNDEAEDDRP